MGRVSDPITTPHNFTPGAVAYQAGVSRETASLIQWVTMGVVAVAFVAAALWLPAVPSYLVARRGQPAAVADPVGPLRADPAAAGRLAGRPRLDVGGADPARDLHPLIGFVPPVAYPIAFGVTLVALLAAGFQDRRPPEPRLRLRRRA